MRNSNGGPIRRRSAYTTGQISRLLGCAPRTVGQWFDAGKLKGYRLPAGPASAFGDRRVPHASLVAFLREHGMPDFGLGDGRSRLLLVGSTPTAVADYLGADWVVSATATGFAAAILVRETAPQVVAIDLALGRGESLAMAREIRFRDPRRTTLLLALAGEDEADGPGLDAAGFDDRLARPFSDAALAVRVLRLLEGDG